MRIRVAPDLYSVAEGSLKSSFIGLPQMRFPLRASPTESFPDFFAAPQFILQFLAMFLPAFGCFLIYYRRPP